MGQFTIEKNKEDIQIVKDAILTQEVTEWKEMKYELLQTLIDTAPGVLFEWNKEEKKYRYSDWTLTKDIVEKNPKWFKEVK